MHGPMNILYVCRVEYNFVALYSVFFFFFLLSWAGLLADWLTGYVSYSYCSEDVMYIYEIIS